MIRLRAIFIAATAIVLPLAACATTAATQDSRATSDGRQSSTGGQGEELSKPMAQGGGKACEAVTAATIERVYGPGFQSMGGDVNDHWQCQYSIKSASSYHRVTIRLTLGDPDGLKIQLSRTGLSDASCAALTGLGDRSCWGVVASDGHSQATSSIVVARGSDTLSVTEEFDGTDYARSARNAAILLQQVGWGDPAIAWGTAVLPPVSPIQPGGLPTPAPSVASHSPAFDACSRLTADAVREAFALDVTVRATSQGPMCMFTSDPLRPSDAIYAYQPSPTGPDSEQSR